MKELNLSDQQLFFKGIRPDTILVEVYVYQSPHILVKDFFLTSSNSIREVGTEGYWYANIRGEFMCGNCYAKIVRSFDFNEELDRRDNPAAYILYSSENPRVSIKHIADVPTNYFSEHEGLLPKDVFKGENVSGKSYHVGLYTISDEPPVLKEFFEEALKAMDGYTVHLQSLNNRKWVVS